MDYENGNFEKPIGVLVDETDISLRAHMTRIPAERLSQYESGWSDEQVMEWEENFRDDGELMLVCCERDVDVATRCLHVGRETLVVFHVTRALQFIEIVVALEFLKQFFG